MAFFSIKSDHSPERRSRLPSKDYIVLTGLKVRCIIGIFDWERKRKQDVLIDLRFPCDIRKAAHRDHISDTTDYKKIAKTTIAFVEKSQFQLIETLAEKLAEFLLENFPIPEIQLSVSKPGAIRGSQNVGIHIQRFSNRGQAEKLAYLGLGSNINPKYHLEFAMDEIQKKHTLLGISHVYETSPVGYVKQAAFWNLVVALETSEPPKMIRKWLGTIEAKAGRQRSSNPNAPRTLDIDLLLWGDSRERRREALLPHPDIATKAFVLYPLLEISPNLVHPVLHKPLIELAAQFKDRSQKIRQLPKNIFSEFQPKSVL